MQSKILTAKLKFLVTKNSRPPNLVEERLIASAVMLILQAHSYEKEFVCHSPPQPLDRNYLPTVRELRATLERLKLVEKKPSAIKGKGDGQANSLDLASILNGGP